MPSREVGSMSFKKDMKRGLNQHLFRMHKFQSGLYTPLSNEEAERLHTLLHMDDSCYPKHDHSESFVTDDNPTGAVIPESLEQYFQKLVRLVLESSESESRRQKAREFEVEDLNGEEAE